MKLTPLRLALATTLFGFSADALTITWPPYELPPEVYPGPIFRLNDGVAVVETEDLPHSPKWVFRSNPAASENEPTGTGYLRWEGPNMGQGVTMDNTGEHQGDRADWLVLKFWAEETATYVFHLRVFHTQQDGDNDVWIGYIGQLAPIQRAVSEHPGAFRWVGYGSIRREFKRGLNAVYLAGRSRYFGIDRLVIYREDQEARGLSLTEPSAQWHPATNLASPWPVWDLPPEPFSGWMSNWMGWIHADPLQTNWAHHFQLGALYPLGTDPEAGWFYLPELGYVFSNADLYPWLFLQSAMEWQYFTADPDGGRWFYSASTGWSVLP